MRLLLGQAVRAGVAGPHGEFEPQAVRVEEVDAFHEAVVGDADHLHAGCDQPRPGGVHLLTRGEFHGEMVHPCRGVG